MKNQMLEENKELIASTKAQDDAQWRGLLAYLRSKEKYFEVYRRLADQGIESASITVSDYHHIIETGFLEGRPVELLNGQIIEVPSKRSPHSASSSNGGDYLRDLLGDRAKVREGHPITIASSNSEPEPDLAIVRQDEDGYWGHHPYPEDIYWLIEFSDSSFDSDFRLKADIYAAADILEYWVVKLRNTQLVVMRSPLGGEYQSRSVLIQGEIRPLAFQDVAIDVSRLLRSSGV